MINGKALVGSVVLLTVHFNMFKIGFPVSGSWALPRSLRLEKIELARAG